jgi:diguanylate cyclase (GGDEF)-like protein/PAS domain S-box-containing protein
MINSRGYRLTQRLLLVLLCVVCWPAQATEDLMRIGVLAYRGKDVALSEWTAHADYLNQALAPRRFEIVPLTLDEFDSAIKSKSIDLVITNTGHFVVLEAQGDITRFATMRIAGPNGPEDRFGGVVFTRADRTDIRGYADLSGKIIAVPDQSGFGGWQVQLREALLAGVNLPADAAGVIQTSNQDKVVETVLKGEADVGFVRSDLLEKLVAAGKLDLSKLRVIAPRSTPGYPYLHSTRLYPHWPFARLNHVSVEITRDLLIALFKMPPGHPAAKAAKIDGWTLGQNYQPVHDMFLELRLPPYDKLPLTAKDVMGRYGVTIVGIALSVIFILILGIWIIARGNRELERSQSRLRLAAGVFDHAQEGIIITDTRGIILEVNETFLHLTGYTRDEMIGSNPRLLQSGRQSALFYQEMWNELSELGSWRGEIWNRRKDGTHYAQRTSISAVPDASGKISRYIGLSYDITALKEGQAQLEQMAYYDALTSLPNRRLLADRLRQAIAQAQRTDKLLAVCYLDLDGFKPVNDEWGHLAGDKLLITAANRLVEAVRAGDTTSRLGGDEFVVLLGNLAHIDECELALERIRSALCAPYELAEGTALISASIGVTLYPLDSGDPDTLIRHADQAMYAAKNAGRNRYQLFDAGGDRVLEARTASIATLTQALERNEFLLYYQPKVNLRSGEVFGAEALLRWQHPENGLLSPAEFLPVVDSVGMQSAVGRWVLNQAIRQLAEWARAGLTLSISINVAAEHLQEPNFAESLRDILAAHPDAPTDQIELELLETAALHDLTQVSGVIDQCRDLGVHFSIDDFGTGYSSLSYLKQLHVRALKIDQSFVRDMLEDPEDLAIVDGIIGLATAFRRQVVAEGVETIDHGRLLLQMGCDLAQGYGISRPMPAEALPDWTRAWKQPAAWGNIAIWPHEDLPLLTMEVEHRRWLNDFIAMVDSDFSATQNLTPPPMDPHQCRFGRWLEGSGRMRYQHLLAFDEVFSAHTAVHELGQRLLELWPTNPVAARAGTPELLAHRDALLEALDELRMMAIGYH